MKKAPVYVIAEAGVNHNGQEDLAFQLVDAAADAGADAVKFQTFLADKLATKSVQKARYQKINTDPEESQLDMLKRLELPREMYRELQLYAHERGIEFLSTAFDVESLHFLSQLNLPLVKVPSGELTNGPLLWQFAKTLKPLVVSTGMASLSEVEQALAIIAYSYISETEPNSMKDVWASWGSPEGRVHLEEKVTLLHCTSQYPAPLSEINLRAIDSLSCAFGLRVGYSDHSDGTLISIAAVARGASVIEKHFTLSRSLAGPDHCASLEPSELKKMIADIRALELALGDGMKVVQRSEWATRAVAFQQVVANRDIKQGEVFTRPDLSTARCGTGLEAIKLWETVGTVANKNFTKGEVIS